MLLAELAGVEEAGVVAELDAVPVQGLVQLALSGLPLLELVVLSPGCGEQVHAAVVDAVPADVRPEDALDWFAFPGVPGNEGLIPSS